MKNYVYLHFSHSSVLTVSYLTGTATAEQDFHMKMLQMLCVHSTLLHLGGNLRCLLIKCGDSDHQIQ